VVIRIGRKRKVHASKMESREFLPSNLSAANANYQAGRRQAHNEKRRPFRAARPDAIFARALFPPERFLRVDPRARYAGTDVRPPRLRVQTHVPGRAGLH
jgi:hypothetical protein